MTAHSVPIEQWPDRLEAAIASRCVHFRRATVLRETDSTQDAARRLNARPGDIVTAWQQTAGRGRLGRAWADTFEQGLAVTFVVPRASSLPKLAIASAIGAAQAAEAMLKRSVGIKWPNDIMIDGRKLAGVLIEQAGDVALIGIGMNISQTNWPDGLADIAISLAQLGCRVDRLYASIELIINVDAALSMQPEQLAAAFSRRDVLIGTACTIRTGDCELSGTVVGLDPLRGLAVRTHKGDIWLDAATTTVLKTAAFHAAMSD